MRKLAFAIATAATVAGSPAMAGDDETYVALEAGMIFPDDNEYEAIATGAEILADPDNGWDADILVGHDFGGFRLEAEAGYKAFDVDSLFTGTTIIPGASLAAPGASRRARASAPKDSAQAAIDSAPASVASARRVAIRSSSSRPSRTSQIAPIELSNR